MGFSACLPHIFAMFGFSSAVLTITSYGVPFGVSAFTFRPSLSAIFSTFSKLLFATGRF